MSSTSIHHYQYVQATIANRYIHNRNSMHLPIRPPYEYYISPVCEKNGIIRVNQEHTVSLQNNYVLVHFTDNLMF